FVFFQFLVVKPNEHQIENVKRLAKEMGVDDVRFKTAQVYDYENDPNNLIPTIDRYSRYKKNKKHEFEFKNSLNNHCWRLWHATVITWDGLVVPCCFDKDAQHRLGDLKGKPFKEIWHDKNYVNFRKSILRGRSNIDICANCSEGTKVWRD
ncbi:MAG TPA: SPASM domain-containing protein, partial [Puia sp.]|nr:SPASM domain-containing protein [Puia sp.]